MILKIEDLFKERKGNIIGDFKESAVMILIKEINQEPYICFEVRALNLLHQPGDVCLPGGKIEPGESARETSIRETKEELNLKDEEFELIGEMDYFISPYNSIMYCFVSRLKKEEVIPSPSEVDHLFWVPIKFFIENEPLVFDIELNPYMKDNFPFHLIRGGENYKFHKGKLQQFFYQYEEYVIWGFTAMMVKRFVDIIKNKI
ncbi:MAG: CoA pyrophosphatase [Clostridiaceae bacterium]|nr:CoA pyrophosphatase [Clostridiaceae bacterium]